MDGSEAKTNIAAAAGPVPGIDLNGTWHLADLRLFYAGGKMRRPWASSASGSLIYAPDGHMCLSLNYPTRLGRIDCMSVCGQYQIVGDRMFHFITASADVGEIGTVREHGLTLEQGRMTLSLAPAPSGGPGSHLDYIWNRAAARGAQGSSFVRESTGRGFNRGR
ncbi:MAG: lipocalin-like domain-containing protein [Rhodospirillaceae bacterium]